MAMSAGTVPAGVSPALAFQAVAAEEAVVWFDHNVSTAQRVATIASLGGHIIEEQPALGWTHVALAPGTRVADGISLLRSQVGVLRAEPNHVYTVVRAPSDPEFNSQYHFAKISAPAAWEFEVGTSCLTTVAVLDTGIEGTHPDLVGKLAGLNHQACLDACAPETGAPTAVAACNHATEVAGLAAASTDNALQVAGVSWGSKLLSMRLFAQSDCTSDCGDAAGLNSCSTSDTRMANALTFLRTVQNTAAYGHIVANMSLGCLPGSLGCNACTVTLQPAIDLALDAGIVIVAAAGNSGPGGGTVNNPGACPGVIPVGATDIADTVASYSSRGPELAARGLSAPGDGVTSTTTGGAVSGGLRGTSFASPIVAGAAALILSAKPNSVVNHLQNDVQNTLRGSADAVGDSSSYGAGRLNLFRALRLTARGTLAGFDGDQKPIAFPNPFRLSQATLVTLSIPKSLVGTGTDIKIYTMDGKFVRELTTQLWDGKNADGNLVASGSYMFVVKTSAGSSTGRLAVIR
jgi:thermitase